MGKENSKEKGGNAVPVVPSLRRNTDKSPDGLLRSPYISIGSIVLLVFKQE